MYDPSLITRYALPRNITQGLGWTTEGTINLGSTEAYLDANTPMVEENGILYAWGEEVNPDGGHYVIAVGIVDAGQQQIAAEALDGDNRLVLTRAINELVALEQGSNLLLPENAILSTYFGTGNGQFIAVGDKLTKVYIGGIVSARFGYLEGEGMILDNVTLAYYTDEGVLLSRAVGNDVLTQIENCVFDDLSTESILLTSDYTGTLNAFNNTMDGSFEIDNLNTLAIIKIQNNRLVQLYLDSNTDFTETVRNNFIGTLSLVNGAVCPDAEQEGKYWHTISTLTDMEAYRGNITGDISIPDNYGYLANYGKCSLGANGGTSYLLPLSFIKWNRLSDASYNFSWNKIQPENANSYRISLHSDLTLFPTFVTNFIDVGDVSSKILEGGKTVMDGYPADNDGDQDGVSDSFLDLKMNVTWYFVVQAQFKLGEKLLLHLSDPSPVYAVPVRDTGAKAPPYSVGLAFPVKIQDGNLVLAEKSDSVKAGLYQCIMTNVGERVLHEHGAGLRAFLFEGNIDESLLDLAREHMRSEIETLEPRVKIQGIYFKDYETQAGERAILVNIIYTDLETGEVDNFSIGLGNYERESNTI